MIINNDLEFFCEGLIKNDLEIAKLRVSEENATRRLIKVQKAAKRLEKKLTEIENHPSYKSVWTIASVHGCQYDGPNYSKEIAELRKVLGVKR